MRLLLLLLFVPLAHAGLSIEGGNSQIINSSIPTTTTNRVEAYVDSYTVPPGLGTYHLLDGNAAGWQVHLLYNNVLQITNTWDTTTAGYVGPDLTGVPAFYLRLQHDPTNSVDLIEVWDTSNHRLFFQSVPFTATAPSGTGMQTSFGGEGVRTYGFLRMHNTLVAANSRQPVTVDNANRVFEWKFDGGGAAPTVGTLADASGNGYTASASAGATYSTTLYQNVISVLTTSNPPAWGNIISQRAGSGLALDGTNSFSQNDSTSAVSYFWQQLSGPNALLWDSHTSGAPRPKGNIWGDYNMQLVVTDAGGLQSTSTAHIGSVAMDANNVVVQWAPYTDDLFGPMIGFGYNPWGYPDYWQQHSQIIRAGDDGYGGVYRTSPGLPWTTGTQNKPQWEYLSAGTVDYWWNGIGRIAGNSTTAPYTGTTLSANLSNTDTVIHVTDASKLDLTELPTRIQITPNFGSDATEEARICSASGNDLTVCYNGRGPYCSPVCGVTTSFSSGATVGQNKMVGHSTQFISDPVNPICPLATAGQASMPGPSFYSTGTVTLSPGGTTLTGSGTNWVDPFSNVYVGKFLQLHATHGGVPFTFISQITAVNSTTSITILMPFPSTADSFSGSYDILAGTRTAVLRYVRFTDPTSGAIGEAMWGTTGCESETNAYLIAQTPGPSFAYGHDTPLDGTHITGQTYSVTDTSGYINGSSTGGINFYGEDLSWRALCYASGLTAACNAADVMTNYWAISPWGNTEIFGGSFLTKGGGGVAAIFRAVQTNGAAVPWGVVRSYFAAGEGVAQYMSVNGCASYDSRDSGYALTWLILGAIYDPDTTTPTVLPSGSPITGFQNRWRSDLAIMKTVDDNCHLADFSWSSSAGRWTNASVPMTMTNGSAAVTGTGITAGQCSGITTGTGTVTAGSSTLTITGGTIGTGDAGTTGVVVDRTDGSISQSFLYSGSGGTVTMSAQWPGTSGTVTWMQYNAASPMFSFGVNGSSVSLAKNYQCIFNSSSSITLDRPWEDATGTYYGFPTPWPIQGTGQQPYMLGIKSLGMNFLGNSSISPYNSTYSPSTGYTNDAVTWIKNNGFDSNNLGMAYGRVFQWCEPFSVITNNTFAFRTPNCSYGSGLDAAVQARELNVETSNATGILYKASPTSGNKTYGDQLYGAMWGDPSLDTGGVFSDANSVAANAAHGNLNDVNIVQGKWPGFFCGMGLCRNWPAVRVGGVLPNDDKTIQVPIHSSHFASGGKVQITVTDPNGVVRAPVVCTSSPCAITADARQGNFSLFKTDYLDSSNRVIAAGIPVPLYVQ